MAKRKKTRVTCKDGRNINVVHQRGHLFVCSKGCCCGLTERGFAAVPEDFYHQEWEGRKLRNRVHLTQSGCLGPCPLANVVMLVFDSKPVWFQAIDSKQQITFLFDYIETMLEADRFLPPPDNLEDYVFNYYTWSHDNVGYIEPQTSDLETGQLPVKAEGILYLTHKDTDLLTLSAALQQLPADFPPVDAVNLADIKTDAYMIRLIAEKVMLSQVIVVRVLGRTSSVPGFTDLLEHARQNDKYLIVVSGTGSLEPELAAVSTVRPDVVQDVQAYLDADGVVNMVNMLQCLVDRVLLTGFGYAPPTDLPQHGIYHPDFSVYPSQEDWLDYRNVAQPTIGILFYRSHWLSGNTAFIDALVREVESQGANVLPIFTASLRVNHTKDDVSRWPVAFDLLLDDDGQPLVDVLINTISFAMGDVNPDGPTLSSWSADALSKLDVPMLQAMTVSTSRWKWEVSERGLTPLDTAMYVAMPEFDGRIVTVPISFKETISEGLITLDELHGTSKPFDAIHYQPDAERIQRVVGLALRLSALRRKPNEQKRIAFILTNSSSKAASVGNAVGLDSPTSLVAVFLAMEEAGYSINDLPAGGDTLIHNLLDRCSYDSIMLTQNQIEMAAGTVPASQSRSWFNDLTQAQQTRISAQWGEPPGEAYVFDDGIIMPGLEFGNVFLALQPPRGYGMDLDAIYHQPDLPPPHYYYALYRWLRDEWGADAIVHMGKHGTLEWLPGKSIGLSEDCFPDAFLADMPLFYPFILNDPGEGAQAKRRGHAVIVDHLTPPMTTAGAYGELAQLMQLVDEYYQVEKLDPAKLPLLQQQIWELIQQTNLQNDLASMLRREHGDHAHEWDESETADGIPVTIAEMDGRQVAHLIEDIDGYLCELAGAQIRDGLHILGQVPQHDKLVDFLFAMTSLANLNVPSLRAEVTTALGFDLDSLLEEPGRRIAQRPSHLSSDIETHADALAFIEQQSKQLLSGLLAGEFDASLAASLIEKQFAKFFGVPDETIERLTQTLTFICKELMPSVKQTPREIDNLLHALDGGYVPAGPSGAPTRGMAHVLPTGRNFYAVDPRTLPSMAAWQIGQRLADEALKRYIADSGDYPQSVAISVWGTSAMRTHGDDVAEVLALLGVRPVWQPENRRIIGIEAIPIDELNRPRIDVTIRISGFFRDAFPHLIKLMDDAVILVTQLDEPLEENFIRAHYISDMAQKIADGLPETDAQQQARYRIFGSKPGTYGAGIFPLIENQNWNTQADFAETYVNWGGYAYTSEQQGVDAREAFQERLRSVEVALHNQDNREHDILDSDDYFQFHGGMIAAIQSLSGSKPHHYFGDTSNPSHVKARDLKEEVLRVYRSRVVNPKWLKSITQHGYKGAVEMMATVDYLFGYDATAELVDDFMYEQVTQQYVLDEDMQQFFAESNPWALKEISGRLLEAVDRNMWQEPDPETLEQLEALHVQAEGMVEMRSE